jgi:acetolactate synthase I/II/III large subunit
VADLVITVGYDPVEYWPPEWNAGKSRKVIHIDVLPADLDNDYQPYIELTGDIAQTLDALSLQIKRGETQALSDDLLAAIAAQRKLLPNEAAKLTGTPIHPLRLIHELKQFLTPDTTVCLDMGSFHLWIAHHLYSFRPRQVLITNGRRGHETRHAGADPRGAAPQLSLVLGGLPRVCAPCLL